MSNKIANRNLPINSSDSPCKCYYCKRKRERLIAEYLRNNPRPSTLYPIPYAHPAFARIGRIW